MNTMIRYLTLILICAAFVPPLAISQSALYAPPDPSAVTVARLHYGGGGDWYWGGSALPNLMKFISSNTPIPVQSQTPPTVELTSPELWSYPILFLTGHGNIRFSDLDLVLLRRYLDAGGFLIANDSYGMDPAFRREIARVFPDDPLVEIPWNYGLYHCYFDIPQGPPKIHEHDKGPPKGYGIFRDDRLVCFYAYESDISDGWEDPEVHSDSEDVRRRALEMGANLIMWSLVQ